MMTFGELFALYFERHASVKTRCPENAHYFFKCHGPRWANHDISAIDRFEVQRWVDELGIKSTSSATRAVNMMSAVINWGIKRGYVRVPNPCIGVERFRPTKRDRFLLPEELQRFRNALDKEPDRMRDFFWLCLLTGARRGNVQAMRWDELDFSLNIWQFDTKNSDNQCFPLSTAALAILQRRKNSSKSEWVFPSIKGASGHMMEPKRAWQRLLKRAGIDNLRVHDLRRTLGSYLAINGESPYMIGKALGHRDPRSTAIYARLHLDPVRKAVQNAQAALLGP